MCPVLVLGTGTVPICSHTACVLLSTIIASLFAFAVAQIRLKNEWVNDMEDE